MYNLKMNVQFQIEVAFVKSFVRCHNVNAQDVYRLFMLRIK